MGGREQGIPGRLLPASLPYPAVSNKNKKRSCLRQSERGRSNIQGDPLTAGVGLAHTCTHTSTSTHTHTHLCSKSLLLALVLLARIPLKHARLSEWPPAAPAPSAIAWT